MKYHPVSFPWCRRPEHRLLVHLQTTCCLYEKWLSNRDFGPEKLRKSPGIFFGSMVNKPDNIYFKEIHFGDFPVVALIYIFFGLTTFRRMLMDVDILEQIHIRAAILW